MTYTLFVRLAAVLGALFLAAPAMAQDLNVRADCGAQGNGSADDTARLQACIDKAAHTGQAVYIPAGVYRVSAELRVANNATTIYGTTASTTSIVQTNAKAHIFHIANGGNPIDRIELHDLELLYSTPKPTGFAILCETCWRTHFRHLNIGRAAGNLYMGTGIWVQGGNQVLLDDSIITQATAQGLYFARVGDVIMSNVEVNQPDDSTSSVGVVFDTGVGGIYATNVNVTGGHTGFLFENTGNQAKPNFGFFTNCLADTLNGVGWNFQSALSMRLTNSWAATAKVYGMIVKDVQGLSITDSRIYNNGAEGILMQPGATDVTIKDSTVTGNSRLAPNAHAGIDIAAGVSDFQILGNTIGAADGFGNSQSYGVIVAAGASDNYMISGNAMRKNMSGEMQNGATGANKVVADNL